MTPFPQHCSDAVIPDALLDLLVVSVDGVGVQDGGKLVDRVTGAKTAVVPGISDMLFVSAVSK